MEDDLIWFEDISEAANRLDEVYPDWWTYIDIDRLDMRSMTCCIFGQLLNGFDPGRIEAVGIDSESPAFEPTNFPDGNEALIDLWINEIGRRER